MIDDEGASDEQQEAKAAERARELLSVIEFGMAVEAFIAGPIGQRLIADAEAERAARTEEMVQLDPDREDDRVRMRVIRQRVGVLDCWQQWFAAYLNEARAAEVAFHEGETTGDAGS